MAQIRVSSLFVTKFDEAIRRMEANSDRNNGLPHFGPEIPRKLVIEEFLDEMKVDLLDALIGERMSYFVRKTADSPETTQ